MCAFPQAIHNESPGKSNRIAYNGDIGRQSINHTVPTALSGLEGRSEYLLPSRATQFFFAMGGKAFANHKPPLPTPRMTPSLYFAVRDSVMHSLSRVFAHVHSPLPLPQKPSHGDIDIMVCDPLPRYTLLAKSLGGASNPGPQSNVSQPLVEITPAFLQDYLNAAAYINNGPQSKTYAIPYPELPDTYIQVDITILSSLDALDWNCTFHSYGALFTVVGSITCKLNGLTLNDKGLFLHIPEIEKHDKKRGRVLLTAKWDTVMDVLGLDPAAFKSGFDVVSDIWKWIAAARLFDREDVEYRKRNMKGKKGGNEEMWDSFEAWLVERDRELGIDRNEADSSEDEDTWRARMETRREQIFDAMVKKFDVGEEVSKRIRDWRTERRKIEEKRVRKEARREIYEEDDWYGNAWLRCLDGKELCEEG